MLKLKPFREVLEDKRKFHIKSQPISEKRSKLVYFIDNLLKRLDSGLPMEWTITNEGELCRDENSETIISAKDMVVLFEHSLNAREFQSALCHQVGYFVEGNFRFHNGGKLIYNDIMILAGLINL